MDDELLDDGYETRKPEARELAVRMVEKGLVAVSRFDGHEHCWFDLRIAGKGSNGIAVQGARTLEKLDYELLQVAVGLGLVGILSVEGKEVRLPTAAAWAEAGMEFDSDRPHAPEDWERAHEKGIRERWTRNAREDEVRIIPRRKGKPFLDDADDDPFDARHFGYRLGDVAIEGGVACNTIAAWRPGNPLQFHKPYFSSLDPFTGGDYADVDALVEDLHADGRFVSDLRRTVGSLTEEGEVVAKLREGMVLERISNDWFLMAPRVEGRHGDLLGVDRDIVRRLFDENRLGSLGIIPFRHGFHRWSDKKAYALTDGPLAEAILRSPPKPQAKPTRDRSKILARDDRGRPITANDIKRESYLPRLKGSPIEVMPPFDYPGGEEQWEIDQLIRDVKMRRNSA